MSKREWFKVEAPDGTLIVTRGDNKMKFFVEDIYGNAVEVSITEFAVIELSEFIARTMEN